jgi:hypothetical protein
MVPLPVPSGLFSSPNRIYSGFRFLPSPTQWGSGSMQGARERAHCGGMPGGLGIAVAIEPAGGASPLRGGAGDLIAVLSTEWLFSAIGNPIGS